MNYLYETVSDEEFDRWFDEALYQFIGTELYFRKARHGESFIRADS